MKKVLFVILLLCMAFPMRAQEEGTEVIVEEVLENGNENENESPTLRNPESIPITCFYYPTFETVELSFLSDLGTADIVVSNLSTETVDYYQQVGIGVAVMPISDPGPIIILITTSSGYRYRACFVA